MLWRNKLSSCWNAFVFIQRMHKPTKGSLWNKMYLNFIFKGCFFCVKRFRPIIRVENNCKEKFTILYLPHMGFLCYLDPDKILLSGIWLENKGLINMLLCKDIVKVMFKPIRNVVETIVKLAPFCIPTCSLCLALSFFGPLLKYLSYLILFNIYTRERQGTFFNSIKYHSLYSWFLAFSMQCLYQGSTNF